MTAPPHEFDLEQFQLDKLEQSEQVKQILRNRPGVTAQQIVELLENTIEKKLVNRYLFAMSHLGQARYVKQGDHQPPLWFDVRMVGPE